MEFANGKRDWQTTGRIATGCPHFCFDTEEEIVAEDVVSCYNCRYRRWTSGSFTCIKQQQPAKGM